MTPPSTRSSNRNQFSGFTRSSGESLSKYSFPIRRLSPFSNNFNFNWRYSRKKSLEYLDPQTNEKYIPYVIEPSVGADRLFLSVLCDSYQEETLENGDTRTVMKLHPAIAPYKVAILPLTKKQSEKAEEVYVTLAKHFSVEYDVAGQIGKRYRRQDAIGTPYCVTVDFDTMEDNAVTVRNRDTMEQVRLPIDELVAYIQDKIAF